VLVSRASTPRLTNTRLLQKLRARRGEMVGGSALASGDGLVGSLLDAWGRRASP
jgi:hypothetical protein